MIHFFGNTESIVYAVQSQENLTEETIEKLTWLFGNKPLISKSVISAKNQSSFIGPRASMITPWSTNAVEITQNMNIDGILRIEEFQNEKSLEGHF